MAGLRLLDSQSQPHQHPVPSHLLLWQDSLYRRQGPELAPATHPGPRTSTWPCTLADIPAGTIDSGGVRLAEVTVCRTRSGAARLSQVRHQEQFPSYEIQTEISGEGQGLPKG